MTYSPNIFMALGETYGQDETSPSMFSDGTYSEPLSTCSHLSHFPIDDFVYLKDRPLTDKKQVSKKDN